MPTEQENKNLIKSITSHKDLLRLWIARTKNQENPEDWAKGKFLEYAVLRAFELEQEKQNQTLGFSVGHVSYPYNVRYPKFGDEDKNGVLEQIDGAIKYNGLYALVEFKDYSSDKINVEP